MIICIVIWYLQDTRKESGQSRRHKGWKESQRSRKENNSPLSSLLGSLKWQPLGDPEVQAGTLFQPDHLLHSVSKEAPGSEEGRNCVKISWRHSWTGRGLRMLNHTPRKLLSSSQGIVSRTGPGLLRLLPSPFFSGSHRAEDVSRGCIPGKQPPSSCVRQPFPGSGLACYRGWGHPGHVLISMPRSLCWKNSIFPSWVSPLLLIQNTSLLSLLVPNVWRLFPHQVVLHSTTWVSYNSTQCWHYLPGDRVRSHRAQSHKTAPTHFRCPSQRVSPQGPHNFCPMWWQIRGSHAPLLGFN